MTIYNPVATTIRDKDLTSLGSLLGTHYLSVSALGMPPFLQHFEFVFEADRASLKLVANVVESDFEEDWDTYAQISIQPVAASEIKKAKEAGSAFFQKSGGLIQNVLVVRETVRRVEGGQVIWACDFDVAVVLQMDNGYVVAKLSTLHSEVLLVEFREEFSVDDFESPVTSFEEDVFVCFETSKSVISVRDYLRGKDRIE